MKLGSARSGGSITISPLLSDRYEMRRRIEQNGKDWRGMLGVVPLPCTPQLTYLSDYGLEDRVIEVRSPTGAARSQTLLPELLRLRNVVAKI
jgi:hypothetical protein